MTNHKKRSRKLRCPFKAGLTTTLQKTCKKNKKARSSRNSHNKKTRLAGGQWFLDYIQYINVRSLASTDQPGSESNLYMTISLDDTSHMDQIVQLMTLGGWDPTHLPDVVAKCLVNNYGFELSHLITLTTDTDNQLVEEELQWYLMDIISHPRTVDESHRMFDNIGLVRAITETMVDGWDHYII